VEWALQPGRNKFLKNPMRRLNSSYKLYASGGDFIRYISVKEAHRRAESDGDLRVICRFCLRSNEKSRCQLSTRGHEMVAQLKPSNQQENKITGSKATITRGEMERNGLQQLFRRLDASETIASMVSAEEKVAAWPEVFDEKNVGICAGVIINPTVMQRIPENAVNFG